MKNFTRLMFIFTILLIAGSSNVWAWSEVEATVVSEPAAGGFVYVSSSNSAPGSYTLTTDNSTQTKQGFSTKVTFTFYRFVKAQNGYTFKGWADDNNVNSGSSSSSWSLVGENLFSTTKYTSYAIFARLTADKSSVAYDATTVGQSAQQTITITHAHAGKITANISGDNASDYSVSSATPVANSVSEGTQSVTITFTPTCNGTRTATLTLHSDNGLNDVVITLTGEGTLNPQTLTWDNEPIDPNMTLGSTLSISATATSGLPVTYTSSAPDIISVNGNTLTANKVGTAVITASQAGDCTFAPAENITKEFTVNDKATPVFWLNNNPDQTEADLKVGESITINIENTTDALQVTCGAELAYTKGEGMLTITALAATDNATITLTQPETATIFSATRTFTLHITKNTASLTHNLLTDYKVDDEIAFTDLYTATNTEVEVSVLSSDETVIKVEGDRLHAVGAGTATITISQAENYKWTALSTEQTVTVSKYANTIVWSFAGENADSKTLSYNETIAVACTSDNTDIESSPITIAQTAGENIATYNAEQQTITASYNNGTATWTVSQPENYKYLAAEATITVTVAPIEVSCDVVDKADAVEVGNGYTGNEITWTDIDAAGTLTFEAGKSMATAIGDMEIYANYAGDWRKIQSIAVGNLEGSWGTPTYKSFSFELDKEVQGVRFKNAGTYSRFIQKVRVTRRQHLTPSTTILTLPANEIGGQTTASFTLTWSSCADEIRLVSDNPKFTIDNPVISTNGGSGTANITVTYSSDEMENATATLTLYTPYQQTTIALTAATGKKTQSISWSDCPSTIEANADITLTATAQTPVHIISSDSAIAYVENGKLLVITCGTVTLTAIAEESEMYESATLSQDITITPLTPEVTSLPIASAIRIGQSFSESALTGGTANVEGYFTWDDSDDNYILVSTEGEYTAYVMFVPANINWYTILHNIAVSVTVQDGPSTDLRNTVNAASSSAPQKVLLNGAIYIIRDGRMYDMQGRLLRK